MPRFYFDISDGERAQRDADGMEMADLKEARNKALETLGEMARDELPDGDHRKFAIRIRDASGKARLLTSLTLRIEQLD
jgi:hypothetical protein